MSLTQIEADVEREFRAEVEKEVGANPAIRSLLSQHGARIKEIKILK